MDKFLTKFRQIITQGNSAARRSLLVEYDLTLSRIDFAETRWESFLRAVIYMASDVSAKDLAEANKRLQELADEGDESAQQALAPALKRAKK
jgi:hypothetical protein